MGNLTADRDTLTGFGPDLCAADIPHDTDFDSCTSCALEIIESVVSVDNETADAEGLACIICVEEPFEFGERLRDEPHDDCVAATLTVDGIVA